jgi:serine/threonine protein kinase
MPHNELCEVAHAMLAAATLVNPRGTSDKTADDGALNDNSPFQHALAQALGISDCLVRSVAPSTTHWHELNAPDQSHEFVSVKLLGTGGFSTVDEVVHQETKLRISRKTLKNKDHSALEELKNEVQVLQKLRHPHIIRFLGAYTKGDKVSILLSPVAETTLALWLEGCIAHRPEGLNDMIIKMIGCLASSMRYLHEQRPVVKHMDIKPQNILVVQGEHGIPHVILSDFGISSFEEIQ